MKGDAILRAGLTWSITFLTSAIGPPFHSVPPFPESFLYPQRATCGRRFGLAGQLGQMNVDFYPAPNSRAPDSREALTEGIIGRHNGNQPWPTRPCVYSLARVRVVTYTLLAPPTCQLCRRINTIVDSLFVNKVIVMSRYIHLTDYQCQRRAAPRSANRGIITGPLQGAYILIRWWICWPSRRVSCRIRPIVDRRRSSHRLREFEEG